MKKSLLVISLLVLACSVMFAQPQKSVSKGKGTGWGTKSSHLTPQGTNFYYTGDFDFSNPNANGLVNGNWSAFGVTSQVFVAYEAPTGGTTVTDISINQLQEGTTAITGGTYTIEDNVVAGVGGTVVKTGTCATVSTVNTGGTGFGLPLMNFTCNIKKPIKLKGGVSYWINFEPSSPSAYGFLADVEDMPSASQFGGADEFYNSYWVSAFFGANWENTSTFNSSGACGGLGCDEFSLALSH